METYYRLLTQPTVRTHRALRDGVGGGQQGLSSCLILLSPLFIDLQRVCLSGLSAVFLFSVDRWIRFSFSSNLLLSLLHPFFPFYFLLFACFIFIPCLLASHGRGCSLSSQTHTLLCGVYNNSIHFDRLQCRPHSLF